MILRWEQPLSKLENLRCYADYSLEDIGPDKAAMALETAETFVGAVERHLIPPGSFWLIVGRQSLADIPVGWEFFFIDLG